MVVVAQELVSHVILDHSLAHVSLRTRTWLDPVEGFLSILTRSCLHDGVFCSREELIEALLAYVALPNREYAKLYQWRGRRAEDLIAQHD